MFALSLMLQNSITGHLITKLAQSENDSNSYKYNYNYR